MEDEVNTYLTFGDPEDGPTFDNFWLDFSHRPISKSIWNKCATEIIVEQYFRTHPYPDETGVTHHKVEKEFLTRLDRIRRAYNKTTNEAGPSTPAQRRISDDAKRQRQGKRVNSVRPHNSSRSWQSGLLTFT
jgi:hypothetical protein